MSRLSIRPRPLDIHKKLPIVKSVKDFDDYEEIPASTYTRNSQILRIAAAEFDNEVQLTPSRKLASEIPTPQFDVVDTYERDYSCTFSQPASYLRGRGAWAEMGEFVEYDLDNEDEDWLQNLNSECNILTPEQFESLLFKFEVLDHKARERAGVMTLGLPIPVFLLLDAAFENLQVQTLRYSVFQAVYIYWKDKRDRWRKPILRRLQPPPPVNDTNPYNVFRPREKVHRLHTRRMQRRENNVQSFDKLRQVRRNLDQAKTVLETLIKREERKRDVVENEVNIQRLQLQYKYEPELVEDSLALPGFNNFPYKSGFSEDEFVDSDDVTNRMRHAAISNAQFARRDSRLQSTSHGWLHKTDPKEPLLLFTKALDPRKLAGAGINPPTPIASSSQIQIRGRMGRGGRIMFDRCNPLMLAYSH